MTNGNLKDIVHAILRQALDDKKQDQDDKKQDQDDTLSHGEPVEPWPE